MSRKKAPNSVSVDDNNLARIGEGYPDVADFEEVDPSPIDRERMRDEKTLAEFMEDLTDTDQLTCSVYRSAKGKAKGAYLFQYRMDELTLGDLQDKLRDEYRGGEFRLFIHRGMQRIANRGIEVEAPNIIPMRDKFGMPILQQTPTPVVMDNKPDMTMLMINQMQENNKANMEMMARMFEAMKPAPVAPVQATPPMNAQDIIALMASLKQLGGESKSGLSEVVEAIKLGKELAGDGGGGEGFGSIAKAIIPAFANLATLLPKQQVAPLSVPAKRKKPEPAPVVDGAKTPEVTLDTPVVPQDESTVLLNMICRAAANDADPAVYAELVLDQMGIDTVEVICRDDNNFQLFMANIPAEISGQYDEWFAELRAIALELIDSDNDDPDSPDEIDTDDGETIPDTDENGGEQNAA